MSIITRQKSCDIRAILFWYIDVVIVLSILSISSVAFLLLGELESKVFGFFMGFLGVVQAIIGTIMSWRIVRRVGSGLSALTTAKSLAESRYLHIFNGLFGRKFFIS